MNDIVILSVEDCQPLDTDEKHKKILDKYGRAHRHALAFADWLLSSRGSASNRALEYAADLKSCGSYLVFRRYIYSGEYRLVSAFFCNRYKICMLCAIRRSAKQVRAYKDKVDYVLSSHPQLKPYFVTLTVASKGEDVLERFDHITNSFRIYRQQAANAVKGKRQPVEFNKSLGTVWCIEVKRGKNSKLPHVHYHMIWLCDSKPDKFALSREWEAVTSDSKIIDVRPLRKGIKSFCEVFKYPIKFGENTFDDQWTWAMRLHGRRMIGGLGLLYGVPEPENLLDDPIKDEPYVEYFYRYASKGLYKPVNSRTD